MDINPYLAGALLGVAVYAGLYLLFDRRMLASLKKVPAPDVSDEERRRQLRLVGILKVLLRVVTPLLIVGVFAFNGPRVFGGN